MTAMLSALPRVEAPGNFEFGFRRASRQDVESNAMGFRSVLKLAAPLALILVVTAFVFFTGRFRGRSSGCRGISKGKAVGGESDGSIS